MATRRRAASGFAEAVVPDPLIDRFSETFAPAIAAVIEKVQQQAKVQRDRIEGIRAKTDAARQVDEKRRRDGMRRWRDARTKLLLAVAAIDRGIAGEGMMLSLVDTATHPIDIAAVEVRLSYLGQLADAQLNIVVSHDLSLRALIVEGIKPGPDLELPAASKIEVGDWATALLAYVECAIPLPEERCQRICQKCGCILEA